jgi:hypothetical protein
MGNYDKKLETYYYQKMKTTNIFIVNCEFIDFFYTMDLLKPLVIRPNLVVYEFIDFNISCFNKIKLQLFLKIKQY